MQVGDLVTFAFQARRDLAMDVGLIVETGKWTGNADVKVLWFGPGRASPDPITQKSDHLRLVDKSLTT